MHDLKSLGADISALLKTSGDSGDTGDSSPKRLEVKAHSVTTPPEQVSPLSLRVVTGPETSGDNYCDSNQHVSARVTTVTSVTTDFETDAASSQSTDRLMHTAHVPDEWREGYRLLRDAAPLDNFRPDYWQSMIEGGAAFLAQWGGKAVTLGWRDVDVFGLHPLAPATRVGCFGLAFLIHSGDVVAITDTSATIRRRSGARLTWCRNQTIDQVPVWKLLEGAQ